MKIFKNWALKSKKRYSVNRKYALEQFGNTDLYVEGLETHEEIVEELDCFDKIIKSYREKEKDIEKVEEINSQTSNQINETNQRPF